MIQTAQHMYEPSWKKLFPHLVVGYTTKYQGDMRSKKMRTDFFQTLGVSQYVYQEQIHGTEIHEMTAGNREFQIQGVDGLFVSGSEQLKSSYCLTVHVGDCTPVIFFDSKTHAMGVVHAGWKGTIGHITKKMIQKFIDHGSDVHDIYVSIGPCIGKCCYAVPHERAVLFMKEFFTHVDTVVNKENDSWYIDIGRANLEECIDIGILPEHIDGNFMCTYDHPDEFFSFRRKNEPFGEMLGFIGRGNNIV
jgi:YfiH family protein